LEPPSLTPRSFALRLSAQVKNAAPFLFESEQKSALIIEFENLIESASKSATPLSLDDIFKLSLLAHWFTLGTFTPASDIEHDVRFRLWKNLETENAPAEVIEKMTLSVLDAYTWEFKPFTNRWVKSPISDGYIAEHQGSWLTMAVQAYATTHSRLPILAEKLFDLLQFELTREAKVYLEFKRAHDGLGLLKAGALLAHHLGDLDRAIHLSGLKEDDPLCLFAYRAGTETGVRAARFSGAFTEATKLNRAFTHSENHRHFALSNTRVLRESLEFLLPVAPFFDSWGKKIASALSPKDLAEIVEILYYGWESLKGSERTTLTYAYPRAVAGILDGLPGGLSSLSPFLSSTVERNLVTGLFHSLFSIPQTRFESDWAQRSLTGPMPL